MPRGAPGVLRGSNPNKKKPIFGVGLNDIDEVIRDEYGKTHSWYNCWSGLIERCYSAKFQEKQPTYIGCYVNKEWLKLSSFKAWYDVHHVEGFVLDKDFLVKGNCEYGPDSCMFVPQEVNSFLVLRGNDRGSTPLGVSFNKVHKKYVSRVNQGRTRVQLGYFSTPEEAHRAWQEAKIKRCNQLIDKYSAYPKVVLGLQRVLKDLEYDIQNSLITETL